jgi:trehalose 6-phosphate phosphatase
MSVTLPPMLAAFLGRVAGKSSTLALDYDGTLAPFRARPDEAVPSPEVLATLRAIAREDATRLVVVSGRPVADLAALLRVEPRPELWGAHGWEQLPVGATAPSAHALTPETARALDDAERALRGALDAARVEQKVASLAVHWRGLDGAAARATERLAHDAFTEALRDASITGLEVRAFDGGVELRARAHDKGEVVRTLLARAPGAPLLYAGDDDTDEDAFAALQGVRCGLGVRVGVERATHAALTLDAHALPGLLAAWLAATRRAVTPPHAPR